MRDLIVPLGLSAMVGAAVAIRTARGWGPTQRDRLGHQCQQRKPQPTACVQLGYDFVKGTTGPVELDDGTSGSIVRAASSAAAGASRRRGPTGRTARAAGS